MKEGEIVLSRLFVYLLLVVDTIHSIHRVFPFRITATSFCFCSSTTSPFFLYIHTKSEAGLKHLNVGAIIKQHKFYEGRDEQRDSYILDEDKLLDYMEAELQTTMEDRVGVVADYHSSELFPERWFDLVLVLRTKTEILFDRLTERGYSEKKRDENMQCEIMQVVLTEARESYANEIVHEVQSDSIEDMESNVERVKSWIQQWIADHTSGDDDDE